jgi:hypothetical protein
MALQRRRRSTLSPEERNVTCFTYNTKFVRRSKQSISRLQDTRCTYNVKSKRIRANIIAV